MITYHQYLDKYPIDPDSNKLILGTIHPHNTELFQTQFFYGNTNSIWNILAHAFPTELAFPVTLQSIRSFLTARKIAVSDTIRSCIRVHPNALDKDLLPKRLNFELVEQIKQSKIDHILCTSGFGKNNAFKLFYKDLLGLKITSDIRKEREVMLDSSVFGRPLLITVLYSPSGSSNIALSRIRLYLENQRRYDNYPAPVQAFKVDYYRSQFSNLPL